MTIVGVSKCMKNHQKPLFRIATTAVLVICTLIPLICLYPDSYSDDTTAYEFFSSFMPVEQLTVAENGHLYWRPPWDMSKFGTDRPRDIKFCDELLFPDAPQNPELYPETRPPQQNTYQLSFCSSEWDTLVMYFDVTDKSGQIYTPQSIPETELAHCSVYILKHLDGAWYFAHNQNEEYGMYGGQSELIPAMSLGRVNGDDNSVDLEFFPLPSGHYALALCEGPNRKEYYEPAKNTVNCYGLVEFDLICEDRSDRYIAWIAESELWTDYRTMPIKYRIKNISETIYYDPSKK